VKRDLQFQSNVRMDSHVLIWALPWLLVPVDSTVMLTLSMKRLSVPQTRIAQEGQLIHSNVTINTLVLLELKHKFSVKTDSMSIQDHLHMVVKINVWSVLQEHILLLILSVVYLVQQVISVTEEQTAMLLHPFNTIEVNLVNKETTVLLALLSQSNAHQELSTKI